MLKKEANGAGGQSAGLQLAVLQIPNTAAVLGTVHPGLLVSADQTTRCHSRFISWLAGVLSHHVCQAPGHSLGGVLPHTYSRVYPKVHMEGFG